tara:strand:+ start:326 stop:1621 length:1296 start_codon:yes stop_codon:yes gene_type:complete
MRQRKCIVVAPYFPPSSLAGVHRPRHLAKHLPEYGWIPTILAVDPAHYIESNDDALAAMVPSSVDVRRVGALPASLTGLAGTREISLRSWLGLRRALDELLGTGDYAAVLITGSPYFPMLFSKRIERRYGVPVVLDFQDPWVSDWGAKQPLVSKAGVSHWLAERLEPRAARHCSWVTSVSEVQNRQMAERHPWFDASRMSAIPIGCDPADFEYLRDADGSRAGQWLDSDRMNLSYVGTFLPEAAPLVRTLFVALAGLRAEAPALVDRLRLNFIGTSNQPGITDRYGIAPLAREAGVADLVAETPERIPYLDALGVLANSDGILMVGSTEPHYTASKIYPGLMSGRPFLSLFHESSSAHAILSAAGGGVSLSFQNENELHGLESAISESLAILFRQPQGLGRADPAIYAPYTASAVAGEFAAIFDRLVEDSH